MTRWMPLLLVLAGCSSSSSSSDAPGDASGDARTSDTAATPDSAAHGHDVGSMDSSTDAKEASTTADASEECTRYCSCMSTNCADKVFPTSCLGECAAQTKWDLACRANHCGLVPAEPKNDHCTHAMGVDQCLDR
jgi:hypothetical protein